MAIRAAVVSVIVACLAAPPVAAAKEVQSVKVCGASGCFTFDRGNSGGRLQRFAETGAPAPAPTRAAPWFRLRTRIGGHGMEPVVFSNAYVPSLGLIRVEDEGGGGYAWYRMNAGVGRALRAAAATLTPRPAASLQVSDIAPGVPAPVRETPSRPREGGAGSAWLLGLAVAVGGSAAVLLLRTRRRRAG